MSAPGLPTPRHRAADHPDPFAIARTLERGAPVLESERIAGAGHMANLERPERLAERLLRFLRSH